MSEHLDKAKGALAHASELAEATDLNDESERGARTDYARLLDVAQVQAAVAAADALERIAAAGDRWFHVKGWTR